MVDRKWILGVFLFCIVAGVRGQATQPVETEPQFEPQAAQILKQTIANYQGCKTYHDWGKVLYYANTDGQETRKNFDVQLVFERPNRMLFIWPSLTLISDGQVCQVFYPELQQYTQQKAPSVLTGQFLKDVLMEQYLTLILTGLVGERSFETIASTMNRLDYEGIIEKGGRSYHQIYFISGGDRTDLLIDAKTYLIRHISIYPAKAKTKKWELQVSYERVELDMPVDSSVFKVVPPAGAKKVDRISFTRQYGYPKLNQPMPEFILSDLATGKSSTVQGMLGRRLTFVDFWATWCPPCITDLPKIEELYQEYKSQGVQFVGVCVDMDTPEEDIKKTIHEFNLTFPNLWDKESKLADAVLVEKVPTLVVLDGQGRVLQVHVGSTDDSVREYRWIIEKILKETQEVKRP